jgi:hypothetical protein
VTVEEGIAAQIHNIEVKYGRSVDAWLTLIRASGLRRHGEIVTWLKSEHGLSHGAANRIALIALNSDSSTPSGGDPEEALYTGGKARLLPIHRSLMALLQDLGNDVEIAPKKGYLSIRRRKQFAMIKPAAKHVDLGLILPGIPPGGRLESAATFNALFSHRVRIHSLEEIDSELATWIQRAYAGAA